MAILFAVPIEQWPNYLAIATTPTVSPAAETGFPASNLLNYDPTQAFVSSLASSTITWDFGVAREFDVVSLVHTNGGYNSTLEISVSDNGSSWTVVYSGPLQGHLSAIPGAGPFTETGHPLRRGSLRNLSLWVSTTVRNHRYLKLAVGDTGVSKFSVGRLFVGRSFQPTHGYQYGSTFNFVNAGARERTDQGTLLLDPRESIVGASVKTEFLTKDEMYQWVWDFNYWRGNAREMLVCLDTTDIPNIQRNTMYCTMTEGRAISADAFNLYSQTWNIESIA